MQLGCMGGCLEVPAEYVVCCLALQMGYSLYALAKSEVSGEKSYGRGNYTNNQEAPGSPAWVREVVLTQGGATSCPR